MLPSRARLVRPNADSDAVEIPRAGTSREIGRARGGDPAHVSRDLTDFNGEVLVRLESRAPRIDREGQSARQVAAEPFGIHVGGMT